MSSFKKQSQSVVKPYCKVCHDAGKTEKEYTSHFVKSAPGPEGKVVCPTLLSQSCGYCGSCGHTPKFCTTLAANKAAEEKSLKLAARKEAMEKREAEKAAPKQGPAVKKQSRNIFDAFGSDSDEETEKKVSKKVSKAQFMEPKPVAIVAKVAAKPAPKLFAKEEEFPALNAVATKSVPKSDVNPTAKGKNQILSAINQLCPQVKVSEKMPEVQLYAPPIAQLVRKKPEEAAEAEEEYEYEEPEPSDFTMADFVEEAIQRTPMKKASEMDWAAVEDSDSDEDW